MTIRFPEEVHKEIIRQWEQQKKDWHKLSRNTFIIELIRAGLGMKLQASFIPSEKGAAREKPKANSLAESDQLRKSQISTDSTRQAQAPKGIGDSLILPYEKPEKQDHGGD